MAEQESKKLEAKSPATPTPAPAEVKQGASQEKVIVPPPEESIALAVVDKNPESVPKKISGGSHDRDTALAEVEKEKKNSFIKAWEDSEKTKAENKAQKKLSAVTAWENSKKAALEAKLRKIEEKLEKQKAEYAENMKNKVALIHKQAEEKRAVVEAKRGEGVLKAEEMVAKYRATGQTPKKLLGCF
ncbi:hypothetical protein GH714_043208 [Hevea brasiliensis]|uniref:Remorin C-terminal domain-containing protein n=1 Tax=Hevea brasiliensis TaxID=3981 RepID=A0A6A6K5C1_HEVBR|nr:hypothetical protein GH714_043208 [Hevea brasiliensis]